MTLGPLPRRMRLFNLDLTSSARQAFLAGQRPGAAALSASVQADRQWYRITNTAGGAAVVDIYDEIGYWGVASADFQRELAAVTASEITVNLNSPGGEIFEGIAIYNALRSHPAAVTVRVASLAASIASVIAQAGDRIIMQSGSQMMIHEGSGLCMGDAADMRQMADLLDRQSDNIAAIYAERAGGTADEWRTRMRAETWFNAAETVAAGLAHEVEAPARHGQDEPTEPAARWDLTIFNYAGRDAAPAPLLNTTPTDVEPEHDHPADTAPQPHDEPATRHVEEGVGDEPAADTTPPESDSEPVDLAADDWASLTAQLTTSPTAVDAFARLREALL